MQRHALGNHHGELRAVGDDEEPPHECDRRKQPERPTEREADQQRADAADRHGDIHEPRPSAAVGHEAAPQASHATHGECGEGQHRRRRAGASSGISGGRDARRHEHGQPRPRRVQLPHVAQIAAHGEAPATLAHHIADETPGERPWREGIGAITVDAPYQQRREQGTDRCRERDVRYRCTGEGLHEVGERFAHRERTDDGSHGEATPGAKPGGDHLHRGRVHTGEKDAREQPPAEGRCERGGGEYERIRRGGGNRRYGEKTARRHDVGEVEQRGTRRAQHEAQLHRGCEPGRLACGERPECLVLGRHRTGGEPQRHTEELGQGERDEHAPPVRRVVVLHDATRCAGYLRVHPRRVRRGSREAAVPHDPAAAPC